MSFQHPLWDHAHDFTNDDALKLLWFVRSGDVAAKHAMMQGYIKLALITAGRYLTLLRSRRWTEDVVSAAMLGMAQGVNALATAQSDQSNPTSFVLTAIHYAIAEGIAEDSFIFVDRKTPFHRTGEGYPPIPVRLSATVEQQVLTSTLDREGAGSFEDLIDSLATTKMEQDILELFKAGASESIVAYELGLRPCTVRVVRQELEERFDAVMGVSNDKEKETP